MPKRLHEKHVKVGQKIPEHGVDNNIHLGAKFLACQTNYCICNSPLSANLVFSNMNILLREAKDWLVYPDFWP